MKSKGSLGGKRTVFLGMDGLDPKLLSKYMKEGDLPNFSELAGRGGFAPLETANPPQSPVAWATLATGVNPGRHGVFDFLRRDPRNYQIGLTITQLNGRTITGTPRFSNPLKAEPFWETAAGAGIPSTVIRWPLTFPASGKARILSGLGAPDIRGGLGSYSLYTTLSENAVTADGSRYAEDRKRHLIPLKREEGSFLSEIRGPFKGPENPVTLPLRIRPRRGQVELLLKGCDKDRVVLKEGSWSPILSFTFQVGLFRKVKASARFYLRRSTEPLILYLSPVFLNPSAPCFPVGSPEEFPKTLARETGPFNTLGMAEDIRALKDGALDPEGFLSSCDNIMTQQEKMLEYALSDQEEGLLAFVFFTSDRIQHFFWSALDPSHPFNRFSPANGNRFRHTGEFHKLGASPIRDYYKRLDGILGRVRKHLSADDALFVASDHGFTSFRRRFNVNRFLVSEGYMQLTGEEGGSHFASVNWEKTQAYSLGFAGIYINLEGREKAGWVSPRKAGSLKRELVKKLTKLKDPQTGGQAVRNVWLREEIYKGEQSANAPDIVLGLSDGYRVSSETAMGGCPRELFRDNQEPWSGTHLLAPELVPGILVSNKPIRSKHPRALDLAPSILSELKLKPPRNCEGRSFTGG